MNSLSSSRALKSSSLLRSQCCSLFSSGKKPGGEYDVVVIGGGHNGLISAAYLAKQGVKRVAVLERRDVLGGACVTEEIIPGFKFSRASYLLSLLRPFIIQDLKLKDFGLKFHLRTPWNSYTPIVEREWGQFPPRVHSLLLGSSLTASQAQIGQFSTRDAIAYGEYEAVMGRFVGAVTTLLDHPPPNLESDGSWKTLKGLKPILQAARCLSLGDLPRFHQLLTAPASRVLNSWFQSEPLKATLATDALIGTMSGPHTPGTGYVLLHHIMGGVDGVGGAWCYPEGGMGAVSSAIAASAAQLGVELFTGVDVEKILYSGEGKGAVGVVVRGSGQEIQATQAVFSNATPHVTFNQLTESREGLELFGEEFMRAVNRIDYTSPVTKINVALSRLPNFIANPTPTPSQIGDHHKCTIHLNCESISILDSSYQSCANSGFNTPSTRPMIEMVIPSSLDPTLAPPGGHVALLFTQFTPHTGQGQGQGGHHWDKEEYWKSVANVVEEYAPGFKDSVVGKEVLTPMDLEEIFGLTGGVG